jgi:hypothetical protein
LQSLVESGDLLRIGFAIFRFLWAKHQRRTDRFALVLNLMVYGYKAGARSRSGVTGVAERPPCAGTCGAQVLNAMRNLNDIAGR